MEEVRSVSEVRSCSTSATEKKRTATSRKSTRPKSALRRRAKAAVDLSEKEGETESFDFPMEEDEFLIDVETISYHLSQAQSRHI